MIRKVGARNLPSDNLLLVVDLDLCEVGLLVVADFDWHLDIAVQYIVVRFPIYD